MSCIHVMAEPKQHTPCHDQTLMIALSTVSRPAQMMLTPYSDSFSAIQKLSRSLAILPIALIAQGIAVYFSNCAD